MPRDSQRSKVYAAERAAEIFDDLHKHGPHILTIGECQAIVDRILASAYTQRKHTGGRHRHVQVRAGRNGGYANIFGISLGVWARQEGIVIHELAHCLRGVGGGHDWKFCAIYLDLVRHFMGTAAGDRLKAAFQEGGVRFRPPRQGRTLSPEQRAAAIQRLSAARPTTGTTPVATWQAAGTQWHQCSCCERRLPTTKFPTTGQPGEREERCRQCRDNARRK